ncbi:nitrilase-related carbon-nitrogen hydrolase [Marinomonas fungiae]|uniref:nitrilase-related carbon-nitrogen hydrolase n=1 Tax=Marinomonas fungiae TaxID=1137284 RepID=UPI003A8EBD75
MRVGFFQFDVQFANKAKNIEAIQRAIRTSDLDIILLPELCTTGCLFLSKQQAWDLAEEIPQGHTTQQLIKLAKEQATYLIVGILEKSGEKFYNTAIILGPEGFIGKHRKVHLSPSDKYLFSAGKHFQTYNILGKNIGILLCYDIWFREANNTLVEQGVELIFNPSNFCGEDSIETIIQQTKENSVYTIVANRLGIDHEVDTGVYFIGSSMIVSPRGEVLLNAKRETIIDSAYLT